jgi:hypothetical protein
MPELVAVSGASVPGPLWCAMSAYMTTKRCWYCDDQPGQCDACDDRRPLIDALDTIDALRPDCPTCGGEGELAEPLGDCPDCIDGKVSWEQMAATWRAVHEDWSGQDMPTRSVISYLQGAKP